jgi:hypothetical protein
MTELRGSRSRRLRWLAIRDRDAVGVAATNSRCTWRGPARNRLLRCKLEACLPIGLRQNACWNRKGQFRGRFQAKTPRLALRGAARRANQNP